MEGSMVKGKVVFANEIDYKFLKKRISKFIEKASALLEDKTLKLKEGENFFIDITTDKRSFNSYRKKYGELSGAVYVFYLKDGVDFSKDNRFFKIGRVGPKSTARFDGQHYNPDSSKSNLAKSIMQDKTKLNLKFDDVRDFIRNNFIRINILFLETAPEFSNELAEAILHYKYKPLFEGPESQRKG